MQETTQIETPIELKEVLISVIGHYQYAKSKHPVFSPCFKEQTGIVIEESLEFIQRANDGNKEEAIHELGQLCAVSLRMLHHQE